MEEVRGLIAMIIIPFAVYSMSWMDAEHYDKRQWVTDKTSRICMRLSILAIIACFDLYIAVYSLFVFGGLFDIALNHKRKEVSWDHIGSNYETNHFKLDDFLREYPKLYVILEFSQIHIAILMLIYKIILCFCN